MPRGTNAPGARFREFFNKVPTLAARSRGEGLMEVIHQRCSGLDVHKETVVACVRLALDGKITREPGYIGQQMQGPSHHDDDEFTASAGSSTHSAGRWCSAY